MGFETYDERGGADTLMKHEQVHSEGSQDDDARSGVHLPWEDPASSVNEGQRRSHKP